MIVELNENDIATLRHILNEASKLRVDWSKFDDEVRSGVALCKEIEKFGYEAYIVGGCVRDIVLWQKGGCKGEPGVHDVDIATNMPIDELYSKFKCTSNNGEAHGTVLVIYDGIAFEVTQFRTDGEYSDGRHPDSVAFTKSFEEDTARRDFTINAMGIDADGNLIDYHGGEQDLENGILRTVGDAKQRFSEDALRIIRALRFAARFGMDIDKNTLAGIDDIKGNLSKVAKERIGAELKKTAEYGAKQFARVVELIASTRINEVIDPAGVVDWDAAVVRTKRRSESNNGEYDKDVRASLGCLLYGADLVEAAKLFRLENDLVRALNWCYGNLSNYSNLGSDLVESVKLVTNSNFDLLDYIYPFITGNRRVNSERIDRMNDLADKVLPHSKELSRAITDAGFKGVDFGSALKELSNWYYKQVANNKNPSNEDIEKFVGTL